MLEMMNILTKSVDTLQAKFDKQMTEKDNEITRLRKERENLLQEKINQETHKCDITEKELHDTMEHVKDLQEKHAEAKTLRLTNMKTDQIEEKIKEIIKLKNKIEYLEQQNKILEKSKRDELEVKDAEIRKWQRQSKNSAKENENLKKNNGANSNQSSSNIHFLDGASFATANAPVGDLRSTVNRASSIDTSLLRTTFHGRSTPKIGMKSCTKHK